jgi:hypothetical protein
LEQSRDTDVQQTESRKTAALEALKADYSPKNEELQKKLGQSSAMLEAQTRAQTTRALIDQHRTEASRLERESEKLTETLERLEALKASLLEKLPIRGLEIKEGRIFHDGTPWSKVNDAQKYVVAAEIAVARSGDNGPMIIDHFEVFDPDNQAVFKRVMAERGIQVIAAKVDTGDLRWSAEEVGRVE